MTAVSQPVLALLVGQVFIALVLLWILPISSASDVKATDLELTLGNIRGKLGVSSRGIKFAAYLGVPYAVPPTGNNRFARPVALTPGFLWNGTLDASRPAPACLQLDRDGVKMKGDEDCLVLNIYKPVQCSSTRSCAVMVWIHGGGFVMLDGSPNSFGPKFLMDYDVILVSVQYRLGVLGFFTLESDAAPGNLGLRDQALALEFIKREAPNFGGDSQRITIFGSGSGSQSTIFQMLAPQNQEKNLFSGIISQSGSPVKDPNLLFNRKGNKRGNAIRLAKLIGCRTNSDEAVLECLRTQVSGARLQKLGIKAFAEKFSPEDQTGDHLYVLNPWQPYIDGNTGIQDPFLPELPEEILRSGDYDKVPIIIGDSSEDGLLMMSPFIQHPFLYVNFTESLPKLLLKKSKLDVTFKDLQVIETIKKHYLPGGKIERLNVKHAIGMMTDFAYHGPVGTTVQLITEEQGPPVYHYVYKYSSTHSFGDLSVYPKWKMTVKTWLHSFGLGYNIRNSYGVCHNDDLLMIFNMDRLRGPTKVGPVTDRDKKTSEKILQLWTNFAKTGNPTPREDNPKDPLHGFVWDPTQKHSHNTALLMGDFVMGYESLFWNQVSFFQKVLDALTKDSKVLEREEILEILRVHDLGKDLDTDLNKTDL